MKLYNTLTRQIETIEPLDGQTVRIYSCGPTVYDHVHIGNLSSFIFADTLRRVIMASGHSLKHVMNFTDVDDKTIKRSQEKHPHHEAMQALLNLTKEYGEIFLNDMKAVGNDIEALEFVKATESIEAMQDLIRNLHGNGFAYITDDGVYFSIEAYQKSGKQYGQLTEITASSTSEARIQNDEYDKESAHDFALWKKQKPGEPAWDFEIDGQDLKGRPGWHIECSAMSRQLLGQPFDVHTGGVDLIFPHHENEIAQSTAGNDSPLFAKQFAHNEHLLVDGQKMSKSLNNFYTLKDIKAKGFDPLAFRLLILQGHYRKQGHFTWENLTAAQNRLKSYIDMAVMRWQDHGRDSGLAQADLESYRKQIQSAMEDDLNTPRTLAILSQVAEEVATKGIVNANKSAFDDFVSAIDELLGLRLSQQPDITDEQKQLTSERNAARVAQDWRRSDELRDQLAEQGIGLRDTPRGAIWYRL